VVVCSERGADLHMAQLMPLPLTVSCFRKIQIYFTFLVPAHPGSPGQRAVKRVYVCMLSFTLLLTQLITRQRFHVDPRSYRTLIGIHARHEVSMTGSARNCLWHAPIDIGTSYDDTAVTCIRDLFSSYYF